jgi:hypothetical protein
LRTNLIGKVYQAAGGYGAKSVLVFVRVRNLLEGVCDAPSNAA